MPGTSFTISTARSCCHKMRSLRLLSWLRILYHYHITNCKLDLDAVSHLWWLPAKHCLHDLLPTLAFRPSVCFWVSLPCCMRLMRSSVSTATNSVLHSHSWHSQMILVVNGLCVWNCLKNSSRAVRSQTTVICSHIGNIRFRLYLRRIFCTWCPSPQSLADWFLIPWLSGSLQAGSRLRFRCMRAPWIRLFGRR